MGCQHKLLETNIKWTDDKFKDMEKNQTHGPRKMPLIL